MRKLPRRPWRPIVRYSCDQGASERCRLRIGINVTSLGGWKAGVGHYTQWLVEALLELPGEEEFVLYGSDKALSALSDTRGTFAVSRVLNSADSTVVRVLWEQTILPRVLSKRVDLFHQPDHVGFLIPPVLPWVMTIHDLSFLAYPETFNRGRRIYKKWMTYLTVRRATRIIADSENTRQDIISFLRIPSDKVTTVALGVHPTFFLPTAEGDIRRIREHYGLGQPYVLCVGTLEPRKNIARLARAFNRMKERHKNIPHILVIAGGVGWLSSETLAAIRDLEGRDWCRYVGGIPRADIAALYSAGELFVLVPLYEGFGLPILEAMACGTPVITSNRASLPEVVGDAGLQVDPNDVEGLAEAMRQVLENEELSAEMRRKGLERAKLFSWEETARQTLKVYREAYAQGRT